MLPALISLGAASPSAFSVNHATEQGRIADNAEFRPSKSQSQALILKDGQALGGDRKLFAVLPPGLGRDVVPNTQQQWDVRNQGNRATCSAFAIVAAKEIWHASTDAIPNLSEEYLYATARSYNIDSLDLNLDNAEVDAFTLRGATFLKQGKLALESHGVCTEDLLPYDSKLPISATKRPSPPAHSNVQARKPRDTPLVHNIVDSSSGGSVGVVRQWETPLGTRTISEIFLDALIKGAAISAAFAVLDGVGRGSWLGITPLLHGLVKYPPDGDAQLMSPVGGHAVCIIGFVPDPSNDRLGWFEFRNSCGALGFAREPADGPIPQPHRCGDTV